MLVSALIINLQKDATALIVASQEGHIKVVQLLLDCGAELDIQNKVYFKIYVVLIYYNII